MLVIVRCFFILSSSLLKHMEGIIKTFRPILKKYRSEFILTVAAILIAIISSLIYFSGVNDAVDEQVITTNKTTNLNKKIIVDVGGCVIAPGVYEATFGARFNDLINLAKGLSDNCDREFFNRNFNLAKVVSDQEKIYVPSSWETGSGIFFEKQRPLEYLEPVDDVGSGETPSSDGLIDINLATLEEIETLPGVGKVIGQKIIDNRPYNSIEDLLKNKIVNQGVYEKIKMLINL